MTTTTKRGPGRPKGKPQPHLIKWPGILREQRLAYCRMRAQAKFRDEEFTLTWTEFQDIWLPIWDHRGSKADCVCLSRIDMEGPWSIDNIHVITREEHFKLRSSYNKMRKG